MATETINSVNRVISILECFAYEKKEWNLLDLADHLSLPASTLHRHLGTLVELNYIKQEDDSKRYQIGNNLISFACAIISKNDIRNLARPELEQLSEKVGETIHLCQLIGMEMFYLDKVESQHSVSCTSRIGARIPAHAAGAGKVLLSGLPHNKIDEYCAHIAKMPVYTKNTIRGGNELKSVLDSVRRLGYAVDNEEKEEGLFCIAAPVYDFNDSVIAAISISGPAFRLKDKVDQCIPHIKKTAHNISRLMGFQS